jgi:hypothetical protein
LRELPVEHIPGRLSFIAGPQILNCPELMNQSRNRFQAVRDHPVHPNFTAKLGHRHGDCLGVDIQTNKA